MFIAVSHHGYKGRCKNKCPGKWFPLVGSIWLHDRFTILAWRMDGTREAIILITGSFLLLELWLYLQVQIPWWKGWILRMRWLLNSSSFAQVVSSACSTYWQKIPIFPKILLLKILIYLIGIFLWMEFVTVTGLELLLFLVFHCTHYDTCSNCNTCTLDVTCNNYCKNVISRVKVSYLSGVMRVSLNL